MNSNSSRVENATPELRGSQAEQLAGIGHWFLDVETGRESWSFGLRRLLQVSDDDPEPRLLQHAPALKSPVSKFIESSQPILCQKFSHRQAKTPMFFRAEKQYDDRGRTTQVIGTLQSLSDILRALDESGLDDRTLKETVRLCTEELRASQQILQSVLATSNVGIVIANMEHFVHYANEACHKLVGCENETLLGRSFRDFLSKKTVDALLKAQSELKKADESTTRFRRQIPLRRTNGTEVWVDMNATVTFDAEGVPQQLVGVMFDITDQHRHLEELRKATLAAEAASNAKSQFLAHMSHEIRTPLNGVIGLSDLLMGTDLSPKQREYSGLINISGKSLLFLINDILDFSKIEAGKLEIEEEEFDLPATVESVLGILATRAGDKGLELCGSFSSNIPRFVRGDSGRLRQVLINLVGNALKFTLKGGVKLQVVAEKLELAKLPCSDITLEDRALIRFSVIDTGIGIPKQELPKLFQSFSQLDNTATRKHDGSGLGLAISKRLVKMMRGELQVRSDEGKGSEFWFVLPFECRAEIENCPARFEVRYNATPETMPECPRVGGTVCPLGHRGTITHGKVTLSDRSAIVVDDNEVQRGTLAEQLESWGMDVSKAASKEEALTMLLEAARAGKPYQLSIIDSSIADGEGMDLVDAMKADNRLRETAIILLTPLTVDTDIAVIHSAGVSMHLSKPVFSSSLFDATITALFSKEQAAAAEKNDGTEEDAITEGFDERRSLVRILVAEDNRINQIVVRDTLENVGFQCRVVDNGRLAVEAIRAESFDAVLMDCQMPEMDGFEATAQIRANETTPTGMPNRHRLPIIALTANATRDDEAKCLNCGMDAYCSKPINPKTLVRTLDHWVRPVLLKRIRDRADEPIAPFPMKTFFILCGRNRLIATMVLSDFLNQIPRDLQEIEQAICDDDISRAVVVLQHLRGKASLLGAESLERRAAKLENHCLAPEDGGSELLDQLFDEANRCLEYAVKAKHKFLEASDQVSQ